MKHKHQPVHPDAFYSICKVCEEYISRASKNGLYALPYWRVSNTSRTRIMVHPFFTGRLTDCE